ncbi:MAG TPA: 3-keto-5-aminohexanoate cleavage protein [Pyrinomonadaceae bacterium]|nr:3-keto-5-aminohexanoate cleavage protein [Pyrinomonadaceae bacterium]
MYFTSDSMLPENQQPLMITVAPFGPQWLPADYPEDIAVSWKDQIQKAVDCYNAGATVLHVHVRDPKTGHISKNLAEYSDFIGRLREAVPKMILQVGGSIPLVPEPASEARWQGQDTRHMLAEIDPKPDQVTVSLGTTLMNPLSLTTGDDAQGTQFANPESLNAYQNMVADAAPAFYLEHLKRLRTNGIQPYFQTAHLHQLEELEHLIRAGVYMGPVNHTLTAIGGSGFCGRNPFDFMEYVRRSPDGSVMTMESVWRTVAPFAAMSIALGVHVRCGIEDNLWGRKGERITSVQQVDQVVRLAQELKRPVATGRQAQEMLKLGVWYQNVEETLNALGLPPNRTDGQLGFIVRETDGKLRAAIAGSDGHGLAGQTSVVSVV